MVRMMTLVLLPSKARYPEDFWPVREYVIIYGGFEYIPKAVEFDRPVYDIFDMVLQVRLYREHLGSGA